MKGKKTGGRVKGTPNKTTAELKDIILTALHNKGGVKYLEIVAETNPAAFLSLVKALLPKDVNLGGQEDNELTIRIRGYQGDGD